MPSRTGSWVGLFRVPPEESAPTLAGWAPNDLVIPEELGHVAGIETDSEAGAGLCHGAQRLELAQIDEYGLEPVSAA